MYVDLATLKRYAGISGSGDDTLLGELITRAQSMVDDYCLRTFEASTNTTRYFNAQTDVSSNQMLMLDRDLCSINSITNGDSATVTTDQYTTMPRNDTPYYAIRILNSSGIVWTWDDDPDGAIAISGKWAYSASAPTTIVAATVRLAHYLWLSKDNAADLNRAVVVGNATLLPNELPKDIKQMLAPYRRIV